MSLPKLVEALSRREGHVEAEDLRDHRRVAIALLVLTMCITIAGAWTTGAVTLMTFLIRKKSS